MTHRVWIVHYCLRSRWFLIVFDGRHTFISTKFYGGIRLGFARARFVEWGAYNIRVEEGNFAGL